MRTLSILSVEALSPRKISSLGTILTARGRPLKYQVGAGVFLRKMFLVFHILSEHSCSQARLKTLFISLQILQKLAFSHTSYALREAADDAPLPELSAKC